MAYGSLTDLYTFGAPQQAFGALTDAQKLAALDAASRKIDSYLRGRYQLPLVAWGTEITECMAKIAAYDLICVRGFNPAAGADANLRIRYEDATAFLGAVQRQAAHPDVTPAASPSAAYSIPLVISSSAVAAGSGARGTNRGW